MLDILGVNLINRIDLQDVIAIPKRDISEPELLFASSTSKHVYSQITHQFTEDISPALSPNSAKQKSSQSDDSIKVSNVRSVCDPQFKSASKLLSETSAKDTVQVNSGTNNLTNLLNSKPESVHANHQHSESLNILNTEPEEKS